MDVYFNESTTFTHVGLRGYTYMYVHVHAAIARALLKIITMHTITNENSLTTALQGHIIL